MENVWLVRGVTLGLEAGRLTALIGMNGSGKSTILRLLAGLWRPSEGQARLDGQPLHMLPRREIAKQVTFVAQDERLDFAFTVQDVVAMGRHPHLGRFSRDGREDRQAIQDALECPDCELSFACRNMVPYQSLQYGKELWAILHLPAQVTRPC